MNINDQDKAVQSYLNEISVKFIPSFTCSTKDKEQWEFDQWSIAFQSKAKTEVFEYRTGIGHRIKSNGMGFSAKQSREINQLKTLLGIPNAIVGNPVMVRGVNCGYPVFPTSASVLYCLLSDADCGGSNFNDFCDNLGYDSDSMSAFKTYQACCETIGKMSNIFTSEQRAHLSELLQDY